MPQSSAMATGIIGKIGIKTSKIGSAQRIPGKHHFLGPAPYFFLNALLK